MNFFEFMKFYIESNPTDFVILALVIIVVIAITICSIFKWISYAIQSFAKRKEK
jgi:ABC-type proline/glycine betaine transport system permease subunit